MAVITKTLKTSGGDYSSLTTWESTEQTDLVAAGNTHVLEISTGTYAFATDVVFALTGWTTGASNFITIKAAVGSEHKGVYGGGAKITFTLTHSSIIAFVISPNYTVVQDVEIYATSQTTCGAVHMAGDYALIQRVLISSINAIDQGEISGLRVSCANAGEVRNVVIYNLYSTGITVNCATSGGVTIDNCTVVGLLNTAFGVQVPKSGNLYGTFRNCVAYDIGSQPDYWTPDADQISVNSSNNASQDTTAVGTSAVTSITSAAFINYSGSPINLRPAAGGVLVKAGIDLSANFKDDVTGATRANWDIGAYAQVSSAEVINMARPKRTPLITM